MFKWFILFALIFLLVPIFEVRLALMAFLILSASNNRKLSRFPIFIIIFSFYSLAYLYSPYYKAQSSNWQIILQFALLAIGIFWSYASSSTLLITSLVKEKATTGILIFILYLFNFFQLKSAISWRGDEDYHMSLTVHLIRSIDKFLLLLLTVFFLILGFLVTRNLKRLNKIPAFIKYLSFPVLVFVSSILLWNHYQPAAESSNLTIAELYRYPFIQKWATLLLTAPPFFNDLRLFRFIPFFSVIIISLYCFRLLNQIKHSQITSLLFSISIATLPIVYFYSSLLYLEMPVVLLFIFVIFNLKTYLVTPVDQLRQQNVWIVLLFLSFLKESVIFILTPLILLRLLTQFFAKKNWTPAVLVKEIASSVLLLTPLLVYLFLRNQVSQPRTYQANVSVLFSPQNYLLLAKSLYQQFGAVSILFLAGLGVCFIKDKLMSLAYLVLFVSILLFFQLDGRYIGYSRWNLYLVPIFIFFYFSLIAKVTNKYAYIIMAIVLTVNLFLSPFHLDGARVSNWGSLSMDTAEYSFPYQEAVVYLSQNTKIAKLLLLESYYPYWGFQFYLDKYHYYPQLKRYNLFFENYNHQKEKELLNNFFAGQEGNILTEFLPDGILYQSMNNIDLPPGHEFKSFKVVKKISNSTNTIYILQNNKL